MLVGSFEAWLNGRPSRVEFKGCRFISWQDLTKVVVYQNVPKQKNHLFRLSLLIVTSGFKPTKILL